MSWKSARVKANGITLHYHRTGGNGPSVVLLHGITDNGLCWTRLARALEGEYELFLVDARGHGFSDKPKAGYAIGDHAADVAGFVEALGLDKPAVIGHSMGAATATAFGATHPELAGRLVLEDPPWRPAADEVLAAERAERMAQWRDRVIATQQQSRHEIIAAGRAQQPDWDEVEFGPWADGQLQVSPNVFDLAGLDAWPEQVARLKSPTLLVTGDPEAGAIVDADTATRVGAANGLIEVARIEGASHSIRRNRFDAYVAAVRAFIG